MQLRTWMCAVPLIIFSILNSTKALSSDACVCPVVDSIAKPKCETSPDKIAKNNIFSSGYCTDCAFDMSKDSVLFNQLFGSISEKFSIKNTKNEKDTLNYMSCYADRKFQDKGQIKNLFCHYKTTLMPNITLAAESSGLSFAVQSCLFFKESLFDPNALSPVKAKGYIQFMDRTITDMNEIIKISNEAFAKSIETKENLIHTLKISILKSTEKKAKAFLKLQLNNAVSEQEIERAKFEAKKVWTKYWEGTKKTPKNIKQNAAKCPQVAFVISTMKQVYDLHIMGGGMNGGANIHGMNQFDSEVYITGAYNAGVAGIAKICGNTKKLDDCLKKFNPNAETAKHMKSIRSCATKGSDIPVSGQAYRDCGEFKCY